jgi:phosphoribosylformylglycinamidine (FGAM) synthase-like enzyme
VYPTPTIGMVGSLEDINNKMTLDFKAEGDHLYLVGRSRNCINSSEYLHKICGVEYSPAPDFDLDEEFKLQQAIAGLIQNKSINAAHDVSEGGVFITLCEAGFNRSLGFNVTSAVGVRKDAWLFGEAQSRVVVSVAPDKAKELEQFLATQGMLFESLGKVTAGDMKIDGQDWGHILDWKTLYDTAIERYLSAETAESALSAM